MEISIAAKAYFLLEQQGKPASADELAKLADKFGWTVSAAEIEKAAQFLTGLELATMAAGSTHTAPRSSAHDVQDSVGGIPA